MPGGEDRILVVRREDAVQVAWLESISQRTTNALSAHLYTFLSFQDSAHTNVTPAAAWREPQPRIQPVPGPASAPSVGMQRSAALKSERLQKAPYSRRRAR
eukprot:5961398-Prymnesium_polylepis.1